MTAQAVFGSTADHTPSHATDPSFRSAPRVLPDLLQGAGADVPVKPKRVYRRKGDPAEHPLPKTIQDSAPPPAKVEWRNEPMVDVRRARGTADNGPLRPGEGWKRRLSKYSR
jgi:hypothetical protein